MSEWWFVILAVLAVAVFLIVRERGRRASQRGHPGGEGSAGRNFAADREVARRAGMSADDQAWEAASKRRSEEIQQGKETQVSPHSDADPVAAATDPDR